MVDLYNQFRDFKSFEVVFTQNGELQKIFCNVKYIETNSIVIDANNMKNRNISAKPGDDLKLHIYTDSGIYSATAKVILVTPGMLNTEYVITYPINSRHSQRREYFRADIPVEFSLKLYTEPLQNNTTPIVIKSKARNICGRGLSFVYDKPIEPHYEAQMEIFFPDKTISTFVTLVYSKHFVHDGKPKYIHAFSFVTIQKKHVDFIVKQCFLRQLDNRRKDF